MKELSEILKNNARDFKRANYAIIVDFESFNILYCIINKNLLVKLIYHQYQKGIVINKYDIQATDIDTLAKLNNLTYSHPNSYIPSKKKVEYILRKLQTNIAKTHNPKRFDINKQINKYLQKEV